MSALEKPVKVLGIIPARMSSGRFPGKPLAKIHGIPMVGHCYLRSKLSNALDDLYVATCDREIYDYITSIGGKVVMTRTDHEMCTDRVVEATQKIENDLGYKVDVVVNIQGDQPMVFPEMIDHVVAPLNEDPTLLCSTMMEKVKSFKEHDDPNRIKIVVGLENYALYMSLTKKMEGTHSTSCIHTCGDHSLSQEFFDGIWLHSHEPPGKSRVGRLFTDYGKWAPDQNGIDRHLH